MDNDEQPDGLTADDGPPARTPRGGHEPERKCIVTGRHGTRDDLIRLALGPDGAVAPDVRAKAPGRGAWIGCGQATLAAAQKKGKLRGALQRAFRSQQVTLPDDLAARIAAALERNALDRLGLEARSGQLVTGSDRIIDHARRGSVHLLLHAADAGEDGNRRLDQAMRAGLDPDRQRGETPEQGLVLPIGRSILSMALGRENVVHAALVVPAAAARVSHALRRWRDFIGPGGLSGSESSEHGSREQELSTGPAG